MLKIYLMLSALTLQPFIYKWPVEKQEVKAAAPAPYTVPWKEVSKEPVQTTLPITDKPKLRRILYFTATWCGPCQNIQTPAHVAMRKSGWLITKPGQTAHIWEYDNDVDWAIARKYHVMTLPTFVLVDADSSKEIRRLTGTRTADELNELLTRK